MVAEFAAASASGRAAAHRRRGRAAGARRCSRPPSRRAWRRAAAPASVAGIAEARTPWSRSDDATLRRARGSWSPAVPARSARRIVDQLLDAGVGRRRRAGQPRPRPPRQPRRRRSPTGRVDLVEGDIRDRDLVHDLTRGNDLVFHQAAIRITQCAEEPRLALEVLVDGTFNVVEAAADARGRQAGRRLVGVGLRHGRGVPDRASATTPTTTTRSTARPSPSTRACCAASGRCTASTTWPLRYFNVYGPRMDVHGLYTEVLVRWMERIADGQPPLIFGDGRQTMDFVFTTDIARANVLAAAGRRRPRASTTSPAATETSLLELAEALLRVMGSDLPVEHGPERAVNGVVRRLADTSRGPRATSASRPEVGLEDGLRELVDWWRPLRERDRRRTLAAVTR